MLKSIEYDLVRWLSLSIRTLTLCTTPHIDAKYDYKEIGKSQYEATQSHNSIYFNNVFCVNALLVDIDQPLYDSANAVAAHLSSTSLQL